jgi:hypothetical protein
MAKKVDEEKVLISLSVDRKKVKEILNEYKSGRFTELAACESINDLYEYNARNFQLKLNMEANGYMDEQLQIQREANQQQHEDLQELIEVLKK